MLLHLLIFKPKPIIDHSLGDQSRGCVLIIIVHLVILASQEVVNRLLELLQFGVLAPDEEVGICDDGQSVASVGGCGGFLANWAHFVGDLMDSGCLLLFKRLFWGKCLLNHVLDFLLLGRGGRPRPSLERKTVRARPCAARSRGFLLNVPRAG